MQYWGMTLNRALDAWRGMWICVRSKDAQKQLARTSLREPAIPIISQCNAILTDQSILRYFFPTK